MVTVILSVSLLLVSIGLAVEIGVASWNLRRAGRAMRNAERAEEDTRGLSEQVTALYRYAAKIARFLRVLYKRYSFFSDIEKELNEGLNVTDDTPIGEAEDRYNDLKKAMKIINLLRRFSDNSEFIAHLLQEIEDEDREKFKSGLQNEE